MRSKSPTPMIKPPTDRLLQETESGVSRIKAGSEIRSQSARSRSSGGGGGGSRGGGSSIVSSSRSVSTTVSERLLQATDSFRNSTWDAIHTSSSRVRSRSAGSSREVISPDLIERLERKTASIVHKEW